MPRARVPPRPPRPQGQPNNPLERSGGPWAQVEASHRAWHAAAEAVHYEDDDGSSKARRADRAEAKVVRAEAKVAAAAAEAAFAEDAADAAAARPPRTQPQTPVKGNGQMHARHAHTCCGARGAAAGTALLRAEAPEFTPGQRPWTQEHADAFQ